MSADRSTDESLSFLAPPQGPGELGRLGSYRILQLLGRGGMGMVFRAEDPNLQRMVALKVMLPEIAQKKTSRDRFLREARAAAKIEHDHIIPIYQVGEDRGVPFIAMPFLKGMSIEDWLKKKGPFSIPQVLRLGREIARGLHAAHEQGLVHRDIKPANLWLDATAQGRVKILDFGLARPNQDDTHLTQDGAIVGTPAYMAPEQAGGQTVTAQSDLFSLGAVLYLLVTGEKPFPGVNTLAILNALATRDPKPVRELNPEAPPALADLIHQLLQKDPAKRPVSGRVAAEALGAIERDRIRSKLGKEDSATRGVEVKETPSGTNLSSASKTVSTPSQYLMDAEVSTDSLVDVTQTTPRPRKKKKASKGLPILPILIGSGVLGAILLVVIIVLATRGPAPIAAPKQKVPVVVNQKPPTPIDVPKVDPKKEPPPTIVKTPPAGKNEIAPKVAFQPFADGQLITMALSPDGNRILASDRGRSIKLFDAQTSQPISIKQPALMHEVNAIQLAPDGNTAIIRRNWSELLTVIDVASGATKIDLQKVGRNPAFALSSSGKFFAIHKPDNSISVWQMNPPREVFVHNGLSIKPSFVDFAGDDFLMLREVEGPGNTKVYALPTQKPGPPTPVPVAGSVRRLITQGNQLLALSGTKISRFQTGSWQTAGDVALEMAASGPVVHSQTGRFLAGPTLSGALGIYDLQKGGAPIAACGGVDLTKVISVKLSDDGKTLAASTDNQIIVWKLPDASAASSSGTPLGIASTNVEFPLQISGIQFAPDGRSLAVGLGGGLTPGEIQLLRWPDLTSVERIKGHTEGSLKFAFSPDGKLLASGGQDGEILVWSLPGGARKYRFDRKQSIVGLAFTDEGKTLLAAAAGNKLAGPHSLEAWDVNSGASVPVPWAKDLPWSRAFALSPYGQMAAVSSFRRLNLCRLADGTRTDVGQCLGDIYSTAFSKDSRFLAAGDAIGHVHLWRLPALNEQPLEQNRIVKDVRVALSADGNWLAAVGGDPGVYLWDTKTGKRHPTLEGHTGNPWSVAFSPDNRALLTGGADRTLRVWLMK